jgi:hypothetical protein
MKRTRALALIAILPLCLAGAAQAQEALREVYFLDLVKSRTGNTIIVEANPETEILVFNGGEFALDNRNLIVVARHARIDADTVIKSFGLVTRLPRPGRPPQAEPGADGAAVGEAGADGATAGEAGADGATGAPGAAGDNGSAAGKVVLRIDDIAGRGRLLVNLVGQDGGKGQEGGQGGNGGQGVAGKDGECGAEPAQDGGAGGWGGIGGQGGPGGRGGNGGILIYSTGLAALIEAGQFAFATTAGKPGSGGDPGEPGNPGLGGAGGAASAPCAGGRDGVPGGRHFGASPGPTGAPGRDGTAAKEENE